MGIDMEEVSGKPPVKSLPRSSLTRQTPVSKHSPSARRARTSSTPNDGDEDHNDVKRNLNVDESDCVYMRKKSDQKVTRRKSDERKKKCARHWRKTLEMNQEKRNTAERPVAATQCHCQTHEAGLGNCRCRRVRQTNSDSVSESELMSQETKLIVLNFLKALTPRELTARAKSDVPSRSASIDSLSEEYPSHNTYREHVEVERHSAHEEDGILLEIEKMRTFKEEETLRKQTKVALTYDNMMDQPVSQEGGTDRQMLLQDLSKRLQSIGDCIETVPAEDGSSDLMEAPSDRKRTEEEIAAKRSSTIKYNTITIGEEEHKAFLEQLRQHMENRNISLEDTGGVKLGRSRSDVTEERYAAVRDKISAMKVPVEKWLDEHSKLENKVGKKVLKDIEGFDKNSLNKTEPVLLKSSSSRKKKWSNRKNQGLSLTIPRKMIPPAETIDPFDPDIYTPETIAVRKLDLISNDIMANFPSLLDNPIADMLNFTRNGQDANYDEFTRVAKPVYEMRLNNQASNNNRNNSTVWSRVAMVLYVVRETFVLGNLNDKQMELLVEHSTKFLGENALSTVGEEGGWEGGVFQTTSDEIESEEDECMTHGDDCPTTRRYSTTPDEITKFVRGNSRRNSRRSSMLPKDEGTVRDTLNEWAPYVGAVTAVGLGLLYTYAKH